MKQADNSFSEAKASEILELAARYYTAENQTYTVEELIDAGTEAQIPDYLIRKAIQDIATQKQQKLEQQQQVKHRLKKAVTGGLFIISAITLWSIVTYNHLIAVVNNTKTAQKQVENQLQRRADLIPQLVNLTQTYAKQEQQIITQLVAARQSYLKANALEEKKIASSQLEQVILNFYSYAATNKQLQSSQLFINLQYEITGTENRLAVERMRYNQAVQNYNQEIQKFPQFLIATVFKYLD